MNSSPFGHGVVEAEYLDVLRRAVSVLAASVDFEQALLNTISACLPTLGDFGFFDVILEDGVRRTAAAYENAELAALLNTTRWQRQQHSEMNLCALSSGEPALHENTDDVWFAVAFSGVPRTLAFRSMLSVPVRCGDELVGSLTVFMGESGRHHNGDHLRLAEDLAGVAAPIVVNARLRQRQEAAQAALRISEERLRIATDAGKIGIWDWDILSNSVTWSDRTYELHGRKRGEFDGTAEAFAALVHPGDRPVVWQKIQEAIADGTKFQHSFRLIWPDGSLHWLATWAHVYRDDNGSAVRMVGSTMEITEQKLTESGLSSLNAQLEERVASSISERDRIWRMSHDIFAVASFNGYFIAVNPSFTRILGWTSEEILPIPFLDLAHPEQKSDAMAKLEQLATGRPVEDYEILNRHKDGTYRWLSWTVVSEGDRLYGVGRDITDIRRQRETVLQATERRLHLALTVGGMGAWQWDKQSGRIVWWPGMDSLHGLPSGTHLARVEDYLTLVHPEDRGLLANINSDWYRNEPSARIEYRVIWPDGSVHWLEGRSEVFRDATGEPTQKAGICVDITQRKVTERNLRFLAQVSAELAEIVSPEDTLRKVAQLAVPNFADWCAVDLLDERGTLQRVAVAHADPARVELGYELHAKYPPNPSSPTGVWHVLRTGTVELVPVITDQLLTEAIKDPVHLQAVRALGLKSYIGAPLSVRGKTLGVITFVAAENQNIYTEEDAALVADIGRRAAVAVENAILYRSLREADKRKDDFLAMLSHELRNPLAPIKVAADLLTKSTTTEVLEQASAIISRQAAHMTGLIDDLLDVSRVTQGRVVIERRPVDMSLVIQAATEQVRPLIFQCRHELLVDPLPADCWVEGDEKRLVQIVANILTNAAKYTPEGGLIRVTLRAEHDGLEIEVSDNGIGMTPELIASAFELFVQGERKADRAQGGLGLGLAIVKSLVSLHDGKITAASDGPDMGSRFCVRLPRLHNHLAPAPEQINDDSRTELHSLRLLIVDDNKDAARTLALYLEMNGHLVRLAHTPSQALALISGDQSFDAALLDIGLPEMDGYELARRMRVCEHSCPTTIIAITGYGQQQDKQTAIEAGIDHYFVKPVDTAELLRLLSGLRTATSSALH